jgi:hypothetical protein
VKDLLPVPPEVPKVAGPLTEDDLAQVPVVEFQKPLSRTTATAQANAHTAAVIARINRLNAEKTDGFAEALRTRRPDLSGLPFLMGDACRMKAERVKQFAVAVSAVRSGLQEFENRGHRNRAEPEVDRIVAEGFWTNWQKSFAKEDWTAEGERRQRQEVVTVARCAALMQVLAPESAPMRLGLVRYLSHVSHAEATRALARLAVFSPEDEVRRAAIDSLKARRERDYTDVLMSGLRYPWPAVAGRAAAAAVQLERQDLVPRLVALLDEPDPRAPVLTDVGNKKVSVVRELVRVNHHKNCLLCHSPAGGEASVPGSGLTAPVPSPSEPLPSPSQGYGSQDRPDILVRIDVTYLRQDFSLSQRVADASPWPELQRFDFLVRQRELTADEAKAYREKLGKRKPGDLSPYQLAALKALRGLTSKDAEPTSEAWRKRLGLAAAR